MSDSSSPCASRSSPPSRRSALHVRPGRARRQRQPPKPPSGSGGTISLVLLDSTDGLAHWGGTVTFNIATTATTEPWVNLKCYQGGVLVAEGYNGYFDRSITGRNFRLYSPSWTGGAADCTAYLTTPQRAVLASTSFHVYP